jgi:plasmid maintenance system antidote protein VapI
MANDKKEFIKLTQEQLELETKINAELQKGAEADEKWLKRAKERLAANKEALKPLQEAKTLEDKITESLKTRSDYQTASHNTFQKELTKLDSKFNVTKLIEESAQMTLEGTDKQKSLLERINDTEGDILGSMTEKGLLTYDAEAVNESIKDIKKDIEKLDEDDRKLLEARLGLMKGEAGMMEKSARKAQAKNQLLDKGLGIMGKSVDAMKGMWKGAKKFALAIKANPLMAIAAFLIAIVAHLWNAVTATRDMSKEMGISLQSAAKMQGVLKSPAMLKFGGMMKLAGKDIEDSATAIFEATKSTRAVTEEAIKQVSALSLVTGASEANIATMARLFGDMSGMKFKDGLELVAGVNDLADANMVDTGVVMNDLAASAEDFAAYTDTSMKNMAMAAIQAAKMGTSLATTVKMADNLLDFETSITGAMEASMMIGRNLNLDRARMLAMDNDIVGATNEIVKQLGSAEEFTRMSAIQRKKLASVLGVEVGELSRLIQGKPLEMTPEQKAVKLQKSNIDAMEELTKATLLLKDATMNQLKNEAAAIAPHVQTMGMMTGAPMTVGIGKWLAKMGQNE